MNGQLPWDFIVLKNLETGEPMHLKQIYDNVKQDGREAFYIQPELYGVEFGGKERKYIHRVRSIMNSLLKRRMVEHVGKGRTGVYCITDKGRKRLEEVEP